jgi:hypothetical protein
MIEPESTATFYREQARDARQSAAIATNQDYRASYLKLASDWDRLAHGIETGNFRHAAS